MRGAIHALVVSALAICALAAPPTQKPLASHAIAISKQKPLHGRFLHITDLHADPFYKASSSSADSDACHHKLGHAGYYGSETSSCDSPFSLLNATFDWIHAHLDGTIDFVIYTGDSARHDNDELIPASVAQVCGLNELCVSRFLELGVPVVPSLGNNDVSPHNIFHKAPNMWTDIYLDVWDALIPRGQRKEFGRGAWFYTEVIPAKLAVFSLNTLYMYMSNHASEGCAVQSDRGYQQFVWLREQLETMRERGMKAIMSGHVPPARTESKQLWHESCWQLYALWMHQFRDVVVGSVYGHMNYDHFMLQDSEEVDLLDEGEGKKGRDLEIESASSYLDELKWDWSRLPRLKAMKKHKKGKDIERFSERFSVSFVGPSMVPALYPALRIIEYNVTDIDSVAEQPTPELQELGTGERGHIESSKKKKKKKKKKGKKDKHKKIKIRRPKGPSDSAPPGPAYSPQTFTWLRIQQYFANLTAINNGSRVAPHPTFGYELEYETTSDEYFGMTDLTVRNCLDLARRIGRSGMAGESGEGSQGVRRSHKGEHEDDEQSNGLWLAFVARFFVGTKGAEEIEERFG